MIQITPQMRILVAVEPVDFRRGIDGLVVATAVLLAIGITALLRLRSHEALVAASASLRRTDAHPLRSAGDTLSNAAGSAAGPSVAAVKEDR